MECKQLGPLFLGVTFFAATLYAAEPLPGTRPLDAPVDNVVAVQLKQVTDYFQGRIVAAQTIRDRAWKPDFSSDRAYQKSVRQQRDQLRTVLGLIDANGQPGTPRLERLSNTTTCRIERVTIPITAGLSARGLLITPPSSGRQPAVIVCPDADTWPEQFAGLTGEASAAGWLTMLIRGGVIVFIPQSIERLQDHPYCKQTGSKDRRWILYRLGYTVGRSMPGLDVQETLAAVEFLASRDDVDADRIVVTGVGQGGMTALMTGALEPRAAAVVVGDYFDNRDHCWDEPVDRRLRDQLLHFGDAELAALIAPRRLTIVASTGFVKSAHSVNSEIMRASRYFKGLRVDDCLVTLDGIAPSALTGESVRAAADSINAKAPLPTEFNLEVRVPAETAQTQRDRHFEERLSYLRGLIGASEAKRYERWKIIDHPGADFPATKERMLQDYRALVGVVPSDGTPLNARSELALTNEKYRAYRVTLDVVQGVQVYGNLLVPRTIDGRRPAIICQHGLSGTPEMVTGLGMTKDTVYHEFGRKLAERGYVVFAPLLLHHNPVKQINDQARQANAVGMMRVAMPVAKTERVIDFLETLPFVDAQRIGYY
ncbi:MAG TPA: hypothetical protein ENJ50_01415, partial [Planctomycetaceae bacterium]|nr:hypothetical protein [Planctomycetaceae bacterium]